MNGFVQIRHVSKTFVGPALLDIYAEFHKGQIIGLVGPDGAGKTTLMRLMTGLLLPTRGTISIGGFDTVKDSDRIHELTGYMPQRFGLYEDLSVQENLQLYADLRGVPPEKKEETFQKLLQFTGLTPFTKRLARDLSGGMKQKLGLACALLKKPGLLLLDEPSVGVDPISRRELWSMVQDLLDDETCIVWSTAYLDEAEKCDMVLLLSEGKLHFVGKPQDLTRRVAGRVFRLDTQKNKRPLLRKLMSIDGVVDGVIQGNHLRLVLKKREPIPDFALQEIKPCFEDAFVDILSGSKDSLVSCPKKIHNEVEFPVIAEGLTKRYGSFVAANDVSFRVKKGEIFGLLGPNGAGKSTTFKMLCGLLKPTSGKAFINGLDIAKAPQEARSHIGYMAQKFSLYGNLTVGQNLDFFAGVYNVSARKEIQELIEMFSLGPYLHSFCDTLPIGFKQKLSFAAAIMHAPEVLFLDEPTSGMDPVSRRSFWRQISRIAENGCTIVVTTHFMDEAENCDRIALLYQGKVIQMGTSDAMKNMAKTKENQNPTLDDAFIQLIEKYDAANIS